MTETLGAAAMEARAWVAVGVTERVPSGIEIYLAPTWDSSDSWVSTLRHIAREGRVFVIGTNTCLHARDIPRSLPGADRLYPGDAQDWPSRGKGSPPAPQHSLNPLAATSPTG